MARLKLFNGEPLIEDDTRLDDINQEFSLGMRTDPEPQVFRGLKARIPFAGKLVPRSDWRAIITEMEDRKTRLSDIVSEHGIPHKDQASTNYCWANGVVHAVEILRCVAGQKYVSLSPASVAAPIRNYTNEGGWGVEALEYITKYGVVPSSLWGDNRIDKALDNSTTRAVRSLYMVPEWWNLAPRNLDQLITCLINRKPVPVGFNWWGHLVVAVDPVWLNGTVGIRIRNSWKNWGNNGYGIIQGTRMYPDGQDCPLYAKAS